MAEISAESYPLTKKVTLKVIGEKISVDRCLLKLVLHFIRSNEIKTVFRYT